MTIYMIYTMYFTFLCRYTFKLDESHKVLHKPSLVMRSETGIKLYFEPLS